MIYKLNNGGVIKLQSAWTKIPRVLRKAIKRFGKIVDKTTFVPTQVKYYRPTIGKTTSIRVNPSLIDFDAIMRGPSKELIHVPKIVIPDIRTYHLVDSSMPSSRPISTAEQLGIPKGERSSLTQDQLEALEDLLQYNRRGKYKTQLYIDKSGKIHWGLPWEQSKTFLKEAADSGLSGDGAYGANGFRFRAGSPYYNGTVSVGYDEGPKMTSYALHFPTDFGSATFSSTPEKTGTVILTSPRTDFYDPLGYGIENAESEEGNKLSNIISKGLMKNFWQAADDLVQPGTYLSGDTGDWPLGLDAIRDIRDKKGMTSAISKILFPKKYGSAHANGLSVDSYSSIIRQGQRPGKSLRWGQGFTKWNASGVNNKQIYDAWTKMQKGEITPEQYKQIFDDWAIPLGGRPLEIKTRPAFTTIIDNNGVVKTVPQEAKKIVIMPHPYIYYKKQGGILKAQKGDLIGPPVPKSIQYTVKAGDSLGKIAKENGLSLDQLLQSNPQYKANPNKVAIGNIVKIPFKKLPPTIFSIPESEDYTIKKGDTLSKIANENGVSLSEVLKLNPKYKDNPNLIVVGQKIKLPKSQKYEPTWQNIEDVRLKEREFNKNDLSAIQSVQHTGNYVVVDKKNHKVTVYDKFNQPLYTSNKLSTGASGNDYNTITYVDKDGNIRSGVGNMSTPAGITTITSVGNYHGYPAFQRARIGTNDEIASSFHLGNICTKSNGCVRMDGKTLSDLDKYIKKGTPVYTLPEQEGSRFVVRDGKLSFVADNTYGVDFGPRLYKAKDRSQYETNEDYLEALEKERVSRENFAERVKTNKNFAQLINGRSFDEVLNSDDYKKRFWDDYNVYVDKTYNPLGIELKDNNRSKRWNFNARTFADQISNSKSQIMSDFGLDSNTYNTLAQLAMGIAEQETKFGTALRKLKKDIAGDKGVTLGKHAEYVWNSVKSHVMRSQPRFPSTTMPLVITIANSVDETKNKTYHNSKGYTQIKLTGDNKEMKKIYKKYNITPENIDKNPNLSAIATMLRLAHMYNTEVRGRTFTGPDGSIVSPEDALLYKWMGYNNELKEHTATPDENKYIRNVHNYSTNFDYYTLK